MTHCVITVFLFGIIENVALDIIPNVVTSQLSFAMMIGVGTRLNLQQMVFADGVCSEYDLDIDDDSKGDFDLCAYWDIDD